MYTDIPEFSVSLTKIRKREMKILSSWLAEETSSSFTNIWYVEASWKVKNLNRYFLLLSDLSIDLFRLESVQRKMYENAIIALNL